MINDLMRTLFSLAVVLGTGGIIYATCAPIRKRSSSSGSESGRSLPVAPVVTLLGRFLAGLGWGLFAALVVFAAVYLVMDLRLPFRH